jgi:hypothetical protein
MNMTDQDGLIAVLEDTLRALCRPRNDFSLSGWKDQAEARSEVDALVAQLRGGSVSDLLALQLLFSPDWTCSGGEREKRLGERIFVSGTSV